MTARQPADITVVPATIELWPDVELLLGGYGEDGCWCQPWRGKDAIATERGESRVETLRRQLTDDQPPPAYLAYVDGEAAGWVGVSVRTRTPRLVRSRTIPAVDDKAVWSIGCFKIRAGYRRRGVARALLAAVVEAARAAGAPGVEAYPVDPAGQRVDVAFAYVGLASMFDAAGFRRVMETDARSARLPRLLVRLDFEAPRT